MSKLKTSLKHAIINKLNVEGAMTDKELMDSLRKDNIEFSLRELNGVLLQLEINGLIITRWAGKDKRRIEKVNLQKKEGG
jgi:DNA-binding PadR family transcriptional regulator